MADARVPSAGNALRLMLEGGEPPPCSRTLGFVSAKVESDAVVLEYEPGAHLLNPIGSVQGGFVAAILDDVFSVAVLARLGIRDAAPTAEMKVSYLRPVPPARVRGVGRVLQMGRSLAFAEAELFGPDGTVLAKASATVAIRSAPAGG
ncbi:MAG: PaaI family thioesterase [Burkholderiales bacterium]|nr:PaaI family thioesterase [Burkholderiales bacterium]